MASKLHTTVSMHYHQWVRVLPTKLTNARPTEWRDTFGHMPATQLVSRHCNPPHASYATKRPGTAGQNTCREQPSIMTYAVSLKGPRPCSIRFRLVTAFNFPTNECTSDMYRRQNHSKAGGNQQREEEQRARRKRVRQPRREGGGRKEEQ